MALPIEYHIEVYEDSFLNDPVWGVEAKTPFPTLSVGDVFNHRGLGELGWDTQPAQGEQFIVSKIEHIFWEIENHHIGHKLMVALELSSRKD